LLEFIIEYWLEVAFGLIVTILSFFIRHYRKLYLESEKSKETKHWENITKAISEDHKNIIEEVNT